MKKISDILKMQRSPRHGPSQHFTNNVMREIDAMEANSMHAEVDLLILLKKSTTVTPSTTFTHEVLKKISEPQPILYTPVISPNIWKLAIVLFVTSVIAVLSTQSAANGTTSFSNPIAEYLNDIFVTYHESILYFEIVALSGGGLLLLDYFFSKGLKTGSL